MLAPIMEQLCMTKNPMYGPKIGPASIHSTPLPGIPKATKLYMANKTTLRLTVFYLCFEVC